MAGRWIDKDKEDGKTTIDIYPNETDGQASLPLITYKIIVTTGDRRGKEISLKFPIDRYVFYYRHQLFYDWQINSKLIHMLLGAGTSAGVMVTVYGKNGDSGIHKLESSRNPFQRAKTDEFQFECPDLGDLIKLRVGHDNRGLGAAWFLEK